MRLLAFIACFIFAFQVLAQHGKYLNVDILNPGEISFITPSSNKDSFYVSGIESTSNSDSLFYAKYKEVGDVAEWTQSIELEGGVQIFQILPIEDGFYLIGKTSTDIKFPKEKGDFELKVDDSKITIFVAKIKDRTGEASWVKEIITDWKEENGPFSLSSSVSQATLLMFGTFDSIFENDQHQTAVKKPNNFVLKLNEDEGGMQSINFPVFTDECNLVCNNGTCNVENGAVSCICDPGFESYSYCKEKSCTVNPCKNGGTCDIKEGDHFCHCEDSFYGQYCEKPCDLKCKNEGICKIKNNVPTCECKSGFSGDDCETKEEVVCDPECINGGKCETNKDKDKNNVCICPKGFVGEACETEDPCKNEGIYNITTEKCECSEFWKGDFCEESVCDPACSKNGKCVLEIEEDDPDKKREDVKNYICECNDGYGGASCDVQPCTPNLCKNEGTCEIDPENTTSFICTCDKDHTGETCEEEVPIVCVNGKLNDLGKCECPNEKITGEYCDTCEKCGKDVTCKLEGVDDYKCICNEGFYGSKCDIEPCKDDPCGTNGDCIVKVIDEKEEKYEADCDCLKGYSGKPCVEDIEPTPTPTPTASETKKRNNRIVREDEEKEDTPVKVFTDVQASDDEHFYITGYQNNVDEEMYSVFVSKLDSTSNVKWELNFQVGKLPSLPTLRYVSEKDELIVVGTFSQSIEHDDIQYSLQLDPDNEVEAIFLLKLDKDGNVLWANTVNFIGALIDWERKIPLAMTSNQILISAPSEQKTQSGDVFINNVDSLVYSYFLASFDSDGKCEWIKEMFETAERGKITGLSVYNDEILVSGSVVGKTLSFDEIQVSDVKESSSFFATHSLTEPVDENENGDDDDEDEDEYEENEDDEENENEEDQNKDENENEDEDDGSDGVNEDMEQSFMIPIAFALSVLTAIILCFCWRRSRTRSRRFKGKGNQKYSKLGNDFEMDRFEDVTVFSVDDK